MHRTLSRNLRILARPRYSSLTSSQSTQSPFAIERLATATTPRFPTQRWYSQSQEAEQKVEGTGSVRDETSSKTEQAPKEDAVQKELESKKSELLDATVCEDMRVHA